VSLADAERTCVACRAQAERHELVRLVLGPDGAAWIDYRAKLPGRGAWVHPSKECVEAVERKPGLLARAFKATPPKVELIEGLRRLVAEAALDGVAQAAAAGALFVGADAVEIGFERSEIAQVVCASDASERTVEAARKRAGETVPVVIAPWDREALGARMGRGPVAVLGVGRQEAARHLRRQLRRLRSLG
jgi:predicted RNA-binding protein YlxR (DUF448 family)